MINIIQGDIFESTCEVLVNPVNCVGIMGAGLAKQFKERFPAYFRGYTLAIPMRIGQIHIYNTGVKHIVSFPTKTHWRLPSEYQYITMGARSLLSAAQIRAWKSIAIPALGCGLGELEWEQVRDILTKRFVNFQGVIELYEPQVRIYRYGL